ncbi:PhoH-like ATPase [Natranaerovirga pectinivora]|uniref:PhoH-like ATPase n=1 Tax=Natranaerovirga pectinivora TaxID=682400 RepID=A0A4R3MFJ0_9FIRM|nr:PhoH family protein [Natranaerovirga pectinivora]TCT12278.1 PhoH-like ATPase [Natranaerovirga pectinivora]
MIKNYIIDTNVMIHDPHFIYNFSDNNIIIPLLCIEELDSLKRREGIVGFHARNVAKELNRVMAMGDISKGITLPNGGTIRVELDQMHTEVLPNGVDFNKNDSKIIAVALNLRNQNKTIPTILITKDLYMTIKARSVGLKVEDYKSDKIETDKVYKGYIEVTLSSDEINKIYNGGLDIESIEENLYPNEFLHIKSLDKEGHEVIAKFDGGKIVPLKYAQDTAWGLKPINREQKMAFELLMDPKVHFVSITGGAGSGKTILSTATALQNVIETNQYRKIIFVRPVIAAGNDIGYLPGNERDKLKPWMGSFYDAIENLSDIKHTKKGQENEKPQFTVEDFIEQFRQQGVIETKTFTYMRGRTFSNSLIIVDEAQEMTPHLAKLMLTRAGQNSKFVLIGDPSDNQIDNHYIDAKSNGLVYTIEKMKPFDITGHVTLNRVERSPLAKIAEREM